MKNLKHVVCAMSGGVDSAVSAYLLKKEGYKVTGCFMKNWDRQEELFNNCNSDNDHNDAEYVCKKLDIPFISVDFSKNYWNQVFSKFLSEYQQGMTPNPDILCNKYIKFPMLFKYCQSNLDNFDYIATGHYSRLKYDPTLKKYKLLRAVDDLKDQSFFLAQIDSSLLHKILFPVGSMFKNQVRNIASQLGLDRIHRKKSSVGICFIGKRKFSKFIDEYLPKQSGCIVDLETNQELGEHDGIHHYTIGQRIPIDDKYNVKKKLYFIAKKDISSNKLFVVSGTNHPALYYNEFEIEKPHWICENKEEKYENLDSTNVEILNYKYDFKYQNKHVQSNIEYLKRCFDSESKSYKYLVKTKYPFRAIPKGQFAVFYEQEECIGSGKIINTPSSLYDLKYQGDISNSDKLLKKNYVENNLKNFNIK